MSSSSLLPLEQYQQQYADMMQSIQDFFSGKDETIKDTLLKDIQDCVAKEHFERAAKLRDIYRHIDDFTQKQTVILDYPLHGIVAQIICIETKWVYVVMVFHYGKMVDVLRFSESVQEIDRDEITASMELEFGQLSYKQEGDTLYAYSKGLKISMLLWRQLDEHFDNFVTSFIASSSWQQDSLANDILKGLQSRYELAFYPYRVETLDISHLSGGRASGGLSCMVGTLPEKKGYRRYKIRAAKGGDDYASLQECLLKRFQKIKHEGSETHDHFLPDLFIVDGGPKQLDVIKKLLLSGGLDVSFLEHTQFAALGKGSARASRSKIYGEKETLYVLKTQKTDGILTYNNKYPEGVEMYVQEKQLVYDEIDKILIRSRDEAHRFANAYRSKQMRMELTSVSRKNSM